MKELRVAQSEYEAIKRQGGEIVAITAGAPEDVKEAAAKAGITFPFLADPEFTAIDHFGMRHEGALPDRDAVRPGVFFLGTDGTVVHSIQPASYRYTFTGGDIRDGFVRAVTSP
ncbi:MAG: peroxiredoxin family protein [Planctomycetes bacterium]|nr:peroxiredoxin family protein [Planctomycetota bacterium]